MSRVISTIMSAFSIDSGFILLMTSEAISKKSLAITPYSVLCR